MIPMPDGAMCSHKNMTECHEGCGHFHCPDCDLCWDDFSESSPYRDTAQNVVEWLGQDHR